MSTEQQHVSELIGSLEYGALKKSKVIPGLTMFTDIPKLGGDFPKIAKKVDSWWFGYYMDRLLRLVLQNRKFEDTYLLEALKDVLKHSNQEQCSINDLLAEIVYYRDVATWILSALPDISTKFEPEWSSGLVIGHPDLVVGDTIYDIKTTGRWGHMRISTIFQLLSYMALAKENGVNVKYIGVVLPCQRVVKRYDISDWKHQAFLTLLNNKAIELSQCKHVDNDSLSDFLEVKIFIGSHVSRETTLSKTVESLYDFQPIQIFLSGQMNLDHKISPTDISNTVKYIQKFNKRVFVHMPYSINLAREYFKPRTVEDSRLNITDALIKQLKTTNSFKGCGAVVHIGQQVEMDYVTAMNNMTRNVTIAASHSSPECPLLIETDSGGSLIDNPSDLADFWINLDHSIRNNVAICLDTCHVFAAGYDNLETLLMFRDKGVPVRLIHYNDSKFPKGSKKDRHESFGKGLVGCENLINVAKFAVLHNIPMVTE
jgi:deoxyribonuclease-4